MRLSCVLQKMAHRRHLQKLCGDEDIRQDFVTSEVTEDEQKEGQEVHDYYPCARMSEEQRAGRPRIRPRDIPLGQVGTRHVFHINERRKYIISEYGIRGYINLVSAHDSNQYKG